MKLKVILVVISFIVLYTCELDKDDTESPFSIETDNIEISSDSNHASFLITNNGGVDFTWELISPFESLTMSDYSGELKSGSNIEITLTCDFSLVDPETSLTGAILFSSSIGDATISITCDNLNSIVDSPYTLSCTSGHLDFTEVFEDTDDLILSRGTGDPYPFEIRNNLTWLSFDVLTGNVTEEFKTIVAIVDFTQFETAEIKEGEITVISGDQSITVPVTAQNYFYSDPTAVLDIDHRSFTIYNCVDDNTSFELSNTGSGIMVYSFDSDSEWLSVELPAGYITNTVGIIPIAIDWALIEDIDLSTGTITISNNTTPPQTKTVTIKAKSIPELYVSKSKLTQKSNTSHSNTFEVGNLKARLLPYTITSDVDWLSFNSTSGSVLRDLNDLIEVSVDYTSFTEKIPLVANIDIMSAYGEESIILTATAYKSFKTSSINMQIKSIDKPTDTITVTNTGCGLMNYSLSSADTWLTLSKTSGSLSHGESEDISISSDFDFSEWDVNINGTIELVIEDKAKSFSVNAMKQVDPQQDPRLHVNRVTIDIEKDDVITEYITVTNNGTGTMLFNIETEPWVLLNSNSGSLAAGESIQLSFNISWDLLEGDNSGHISFSTNGAYSNSHIINLSIED